MTKSKITKKQKEELIKKFGHIPTKEEIFQKLLQSQERLAQALKGAWETAPDDENIKQTLLEVGEKSSKLKKDIEGLFKTKKK